ncbi:beta-galactosidase [Chitinilyticum piscinae]|uniref:Beta-galactosidase n=1 Tax=Chitinilyticum piscinae TaxID=2866724 RepID=A0A8J7G3G6_9NEIS|nr:beta-galactosidase [Chitinilyticum piscinae]MBE9610688.1 beta-galactosidase [Chitinilyticum piscinae]
MTIYALLDPAFPAPHPLPDTLPDQWQALNVRQLATALTQAKAGSVYVHLYGSAFPRAAWPALKQFLAQGGNLVSLGRTPFGQPVDEHGQTTAQAALFRDLDIHEIQHVDCGAATQLKSSALPPWLDGQLACLSTQAATDGFVLMPTKDKDQPLDSGSAGPMDARIVPLASVLNAQGHAIASPVVMIERLRGAMAGSRQLFVTVEPGAAFWQNGGMAMLDTLTKYAAHGVTEWWLKPDFACYEPGEVATLTLQGEALGATRGQRWTARITTTYGLEALDERELQLDTLQDGPISKRFTLPYPIRAGRYAISATLTSDAGEIIKLEQGFWGRDAELLARGTRLKAGRDYFERDGQVMPVVGMTYMASDVHRKFLQLPNVAMWDADMATLAGMGVNYLRTGIWSAWRQLMFVDGHASEALLRAIDAFILTCASHDLECCFTFFAFTPEAWEGSNPYLDPRSRAAQKRFIRSVVARHTDTKRVHWDLINEPSLFDPERIFVGPRTLHDKHENQAFRDWLRARNPDIAHWQAAWDMSPAKLPDFSAIRPPQPEKIGFNTTEIAPKQHGLWLDYALFTQNAHRDWAADLAASIRELVPDVLVCVGQDEALGQQRPHAFFYADAVDYTTVHSWWLNDALGWDSLFSKTPHKPNLVQETGIMHVERPNGRSRRSEAELMQLLERKYAYSYAYGNAGAVHWIWNINYHMDNINESHIGACRADGSQKPEAEITAAFGEFFGKVGVLLHNRELPKAAVVYPFANDYSNRRTTLDATQALVRQFGFELGVNLQAVSDHDLSSLMSAPPQLLLLPCPFNLDDGCWEQVKALLATHPVTLLLTGPATLDRYFNATERAPFDQASIRNLSREEPCEIGGTVQRATFAGEAIARIETGVAASGDSAQLQRIPFGQGRRGQILWHPLPLELNANPAALNTLYREALHAANLTADFIWQGEAPMGVFLHAQHFAGHTLWIAISETSRDQLLQFSDPRSGRHYQTQLAAGRAQLWLTDSKGAVVASLRNHAVEVVR